MKFKNCQCVKNTKEYPWPCAKNPNRTILIFNDDMLQRASNGTFTKLTGIGCLNIQIPEEDIVEVGGES
jgi:hypothetical protein